MSDNKKQSLFLKSIKQNTCQIDSSQGFPSIPNIQKTLLEQNLEKKFEKIDNPIKKNEFFGISQNEYTKINQESNEILKKMDISEIEETKKELMSSLDPRILKFFTNNKLKNEFNDQSKNLKNEENNTSSIQEESEKSEWLSKIYFDNNGNETIILDSEEKKEEKIELFCDKQEHSIENLMNILYLYQNNPALSGFSIYKLSKIFNNFYNIFKEKMEYISFSHLENRILRTDFLKEIFDKYHIIETISKFLSQMSVTLNANSLRLLQKILKILVGKNFSIFIKAKNQIIHDLGSFFSLFFYLYFFKGVCEVFSNYEIFKSIFIILEKKELIKDMLIECLDIFSLVLYLDIQKRICIEANDLEVVYLMKN